VLLESVPNVSEGRDLAVIAAVGQSFAGRAELLDVHSDLDHHRSVFTLVADEQDLAEALLAGIATAASLIDLREHDGIHPRIGAADVVPIVPLGGAGLDRAVDVAHELGRRIGDELGLPVFLYGASGHGLRPAFFRRGGPAELQRRLDTGEVRPDFGPWRLDPRAGGVILGARQLLIAFNLELRTGTLEDAQAIAAAVRESSGGMRGVQALGLLLPGSQRVQVSLNVIDVEAARLADVVALVREVAASRGVEVGAGELVGLLPESGVAEATHLGLDALPDEVVLERRVGRLLGRDHWRLDAG
jgi:glutamate formiminotransferase/glutamate formiminotransferase/formiminotetrahydrofolate cyclodeaminase